MRIFLAALLLSCFMAAPAFATTPAAPAVDEKAIEKSVETYLSSITTLKSRFIQTSQGGDQVAGTFYLKRPGKMRFQYDPPMTDFIVADGTFVYYYDGELKQQSSTLISQSLADFFLRKKLTLSGDLRVDAIRRDGEYLIINMVQAKDPLAGSLSLLLTEAPMQLKKWRVVDAQGLITEVELFEIQTGISLDGDLFHYYDPARIAPKMNK